MFREDNNVGFFHNNISSPTQLFVHAKIKLCTNYAMKTYEETKKKRHAFQALELETVQLENLTKGDHKIKG
jgi:hypothetical protein